MRYSPLLVALVMVAGCNALVGVEDLNLDTDAASDASVPDAMAGQAPEMDGSRDDQLDGAPTDATKAPNEEDDRSPLDSPGTSDVPDGTGDDAESNVPDAGNDGNLEAGADAEPIPDATSPPDSALPDSDLTPDAVPVADGGADADEAGDDTG